MRVCVQVCVRFWKLKYGFEVCGSLNMVSRGKEEGWKQMEVEKGL